MRVPSIRVRVLCEILHAGLAEVFLSRVLMVKLLRKVSLLTKSIIRAHPALNLSIASMASFISLR